MTDPNETNESNPSTSDAGAARTGDNGEPSAEPSTKRVSTPARAASVAPPPVDPPAATATAAPEDPIAQAKADVERFREQWMRTAADFDNFRKRSRREIEDARKSGREELLKEMLPVFDNLERALQSSKGATDVKGVVDGLQMILKQFDSTLGRVGITRVPTIGSPFDPSLHEAIQQVETDEHPPGTVVAEVQPGYMAGDKLVRAAMVVVAKPKAGGDAEAAS
jgi:molecular chaperone GrpE